MKRTPKIILGLFMPVVLSAIFLYAPSALGLGDLSRIIYFHVPLAWIGVLAYLYSMVYSIYYLRTEILYNDAKAALNAEIGMVFTILATLTGAIFARYTWGVFWNWDPRQTSIFILLLIYGAYFALRSAVEDEDKRAKLSSVFSIFAFISVPFLVFIIPRVYATLHPDPILSIDSGFRMDAAMFRVFLASLVAFTGLYFWLADLGARYLKVKNVSEGGKNV